MRALPPAAHPDGVPMRTDGDGVATLEWLSRAFGSRECARLTQEDGPLSHGELQTGSGRIVPAPTPGYEGPKRHRQHCEAALPAAGPLTTPASTRGLQEEGDTPQRRVILVKHALPELEAAVAPRYWTLGSRGEAGARALAAELRRFGAFRLEHSPEPKARRTAAEVARELGLERYERGGFEEIDRPPQPILPRAEHAAHNARLFAEPSRAVVGCESAEQALARFESALAAALSHTPADEDLVVITHGTVIALLVAAHNPIDGFALWQRLQCPSFVVLLADGYRLHQVRDELAPADASK